MIELFCGILTNHCTTVRTNADDGPWFECQCSAFQSGQECSEPGMIWFNGRIEWAWGAADRESSAVNHYRIVYSKGCPVCEFPTPMEDYDICPSCGFEACGQEDWPNGENWPYLRQAWVAGGRKWWSSYYVKPDNWPPSVEKSGAKK